MLQTACHRPGSQSHQGSRRATERGRHPQPAKDPLWLVKDTSAAPARREGSLHCPCLTRCCGARVGARSPSTGPRGPTPALGRAGSAAQSLPRRSHPMKSLLPLLGNRPKSALSPPHCTVIFLILPIFNFSPWTEMWLQKISVSWKEGTMPGSAPVLSSEESAITDQKTQQNKKNPKTPVTKTKQKSFSNFSEILPCSCFF